MRSVAPAYAASTIAPSAEKSTEAMNGSWTVSKWLDGLETITDQISAALCAEDVSQEEHMKQLCTLGTKDDDELREKIREQLLEGDVVSKLVDVLLPAVKDMAADYAHASTLSAEALNSKFASSAGTYTLSYSDLSSFFGGLEGKVGPPLAHAISGKWDGLEGSMAAEHCDRDDSDADFTASNYGTTTTSKTEHGFCAAPEDAAAWPKESKLQGAALSSRRRKPLPLVELRSRIEAKNALLREAGEPTLIEVEAIGARLYTGPLFVKYNAVLRGHDPDAPTFLREQFTSLCRGNVYATTLHIINSSLVKLSKLTYVTKVYRGVSGGVLPEAFWKPNAFGVCGGVETAFMSATLDPTVAQFYASQPGKPGTVLEIQQGMVDRGADMSWLSQYPAEAEILFAPLTGLEVQYSAVKGTTIKVGTRLSVNLAAPTIEQVLARRQKVVQRMASHMSASLERELNAPMWVKLLTMLEADMKRSDGSTVDIRSYARAQLDTALRRATHHPASFYNEDVSLGAAISEAVEARRSVDWPRGVRALLKCGFGMSSEDSTPTVCLRRICLKAPRGTAVQSSKTPEEDNLVTWLKTASIEKLDFGRQHLGDEGVGALALLLHGVQGALSKVRRLQLDKTGTGSVGSKVLYLAIEEGALPELQLLSLSGNALSDAGIGSLADALSTGAMPHMRTLLLKNVGCSDVGFNAICKALDTPGVAVLQELKELDLEDNEISDDSMASFGEALKAGALPSLTLFNVGANEVGDVGIAALAAAVRGGALRHLIELDLDNNNIDDAGLIELAEAMGSGGLAELRVFSLDDNMIGDEGVGAFAAACLAAPTAMLPALEVMDLDGSDIRTPGFDKLAEALAAQALPSLKTLEIDDDLMNHAALNEICAERGVTLR